VGAVDPRGGRFLDDRGEASMTGLEVLLALAGSGVTLLVVAGMILLTPRGQVEVHAEGTDPQGSNLSPTQAPDQPPRVPTSA